MQIQIQEQHVQIDMEVAKPDLTSALKDVRQQYETLASRNLQESEDWYKTKVCLLTLSCWLFFYHIKISLVELHYHITCFS